jgi:phage-related baseplate assembly protein
MASSYTTVDLSKLPAPNVVEVVNFEDILAAMLADYQARMVAAGQPFTALVESDPAFKQLETAAYREVIQRQRINDAAKAVMLPYALGTDLDNIGANFDVERLLLDAGDATATPPVPPTYEADDDFRRRIQLSFEGYSTAGSEGSYVFHALSADGNIRDVSVTSPSPGQVSVYVLAKTGNGTATDEMISNVVAALNADQVRPMTDQVSVFSANIVNYQVTANLVLYPGPDSSVVQQAALDAVTAHVASIAKMGLDVSISGILAQLHQPGVQDVQLTSPAANIAISPSQASNCTAITLTVSLARNE